MLSVLIACAPGFASFPNDGASPSGSCPMASVRSDTNKCVECPAGKTNYAAGETTCTYAFSTAAAPDYFQDGLNLVEAKVNIQALFKLPHADEFSGEDTITCTQTKYRSADGTCTTVAVPLDGAANTPFGRLLDADFTYTVDDPPAAAVAEAFLHRPANASRVSSLAHSAMMTAWIQFMIHDWIQHSDTSYNGEDYTELNNYSSWADCSQLYGNNQAEQDKVRTGVGGLVKVGEDALLRDGNGVPITGVTINWWAGVEMMHVIFHKEHNSIAAALASAYPSMDDEALFQTARLVVSALVTKIHATQWTPPLFNHPAINAGLQFGWDQSEETQKYVNSQILGDDPRLVAVMKYYASTIQPGKRLTSRHSLTELFTTVYRLHATLPDAITGIGQMLELTSHAKSGEVLKQSGLKGVVDGFMATPMALNRLNNYPDFFRETQMAEIDVSRDRQRGVGRYNRLLKTLGLPVKKEWADFSRDVRLQEKLKSIYGDDIDKVDIQVGLLADSDGDFNHIQGIEVSNAAFLVFLLQANMRTENDRFFSEDRTPEIYTKVGYDWVNENNMNTVMARHGVPPHNESDKYSPFMLADSTLCEVIPGYCPAGL